MNHVLVAVVGDTSVGKDVLCFQMALLDLYGGLRGPMWLGKTHLWLAHRQLWRADHFGLHL